jgi:hypothetical protein
MAGVLTAAIKKRGNHKNRFTIFGALVMVLPKIGED